MSERTKAGRRPGIEQARVRTVELPPLPPPRPPKSITISEPRESVVQMTGAARRALALEWFQRGFACSGQGFNGESPGAARPGFLSMLEAEFGLAWSQRK